MEGDKAQTKGIKKEIGTGQTWQIDQREMETNARSHREEQILVERICSESRGEMLREGRHNWIQSFILADQGDKTGGGCS